MPKYEIHVGHTRGRAMWFCQHHLFMFKRLTRSFTNLIIASPGVSYNTWHRLIVHFKTRSPFSTLFIHVCMWRYGIGVIHLSLLLLYLYPVLIKRSLWKSEYSRRTVKTSSKASDVSERAFSLARGVPHIPWFRCTDEFSYLCFGNLFFSSKTERYKKVR